MSALEKEISKFVEFLIKGKKKYWILGLLALWWLLPELSNRIEAWEKISDTKIYKSFTTGVSYCYSKLINFLNIEITLWNIIVAVISIVIVLIFVVYIWNAFQDEAVPTQNKSSNPEYLNYRDATINKLRWTWSYIRTTEGWQINEITGHCPSCDTHMSHERYSSYWETYSCPRCKVQITNHNSSIYGHDPRFTPLKDVELIIIDNIRRMQEEKKRLKPINIDI